MEPIVVKCKNPECNKKLVKRTMSEMGRKYCSLKCSVEYNGHQINGRRKKQ